MSEPYPPAGQGQGDPYPGSQPYPGAQGYPGAPAYPGGQAGAQPYPGGPAYGQPGGFGGPFGGMRNGMGTAALVLGIVGIIPLGGLVIPNVLAIVFGFVGRGRAKRGESSNGGTALAGIILGFIGLVVSAIVIVVIVNAVRHTTCTQDYGSNHVTCVRDSG